MEQITRETERENELGIPRGWDITPSRQQDGWWNLWYWSTHDMQWNHMSTLETYDEARQLAHELNRIETGAQRG